MTPTLTHRDDCPNPATPLQASMGRMGDPMLTCPACKAWKVARKAEPAPAPVLLVRRWRCGNHPANVVTWKGTGCPKCEEARAARQRDREHAARARRERAERDRQG